MASNVVNNSEVEVKQDENVENVVQEYTKVQNENED